ncbi:MAG TPA: glycine cleavage system protein GcvH, partial [Ktedonobacterales bacterium]
KYSKTHEWARIEGNQATIGITSYAEEELGDVVYLELPWDDAGKLDLKSGEHFGDIESVKATSELFTPLGGRLVRVNEALRDSPELVNSDPYGQGWMLVVELSDPSQANSLMDAQQYEQFAQSSGH